MIFHVAFAVLALAVTRLIWVHFHPYKDCRWCRDKRRGARCWRCHRRRQVRRLGAWHTHKLALSLREAWAEWRAR